MADLRRYLPDFNYGPLGQLTYIPSDSAGEDAGRFHTTRILSDKPSFRILNSPSKQWFPPQVTPSVTLPPQKAQRVKLQQRWLLNTHPDAFMGDEPLRDILAEERTDPYDTNGGATASTPRGPLLALGQIRDVSDPWATGSVPVLAVAAGESGELLRLATLRKTKMGWKADPSQQLIMLGFDELDLEETAFWSGDALPLSRIRFAVNMAKHDPVRWLVVQTKNATVILQPDYHAVPVAQNRGFAHQPVPPSRINPQPVINLSCERTGGRPHADFSINMSGEPMSEPPQLAVIDECGHWTVWDINRGGKKSGLSKIKLEFKMAGHVTDGILENVSKEGSVPRRSAHPAVEHGVLWVGREAERKVKLENLEDLDDNNFKVEYGMKGKGKGDGRDDDMNKARSRGRSGKEEMLGVDLEAAARSRTLAAWSRSELSLVDVVDGIVWPAFRFLKASRVNAERILEVQMNPLNKDHIFVLTTRHLFWLNLFPQKNSQAQQRKPLVLVKCPHMRDGADSTLRMTTWCERFVSGDEFAVATIYSAKEKQLTAYWLGMGQGVEAGLPHFHHQIVSTVGLLTSNSSPSNFQTLTMTPASLEAVVVRGKQEAAADMLAYAHKGLRFQQLFVLDYNLSLRSTLATSFRGFATEVIAPPDSRPAIPSSRRRPFEREQQKYLKVFADVFVVPDGLPEPNEMVARRDFLPAAVAADDGNARNDDVENGKLPLVRTVTPTPRIFKFPALASNLGAYLESLAARDPMGPTVSVFDVIRETMEERLEESERMLPTTLLHLASPVADSLGGFNQTDLEQGLRAIQDERPGDDVSVIRVARRLPKESENGPVDVAATERQLSYCYVDSLPTNASPDVRQWRQSLVSELTRTLVLSSYTVLVGSPSPPLTESISTRESSITAPLPSSPSAPASVHPPTSPSRSRASTPGPSRSRPQSRSRDAALLESQAAIGRLRALALSIDTSAPRAHARQHPILARWPDERGSDPAEYVSSVAETADSQLGAARTALEKRARIERRRRERNEKYGAMRTQSLEPRSEGTGGGAGESWTKEGGEGRESGRKLAGSWQAIRTGGRNGGGETSRSQSAGPSQEATGPRPVMTSQPTIMFGERRKAIKKSATKKIRGFR